VSEIEAEIGNVFASSRSVLALANAEEMPRRIVEGAMDALAADDASLLLPGPDGTLRLAYSSKIPKHEWSIVRIPIGGSIAGKVALTREPLLINDPIDRPASTQRRRVCSSIVYPVVARSSELLGVLNLNRLKPDRPFDASDLSRARVFAASVELALENLVLVERMVGEDRQAMLRHLTAGIAHEINTPVQYCLDSVSFLRGAFDALTKLSAAERGLLGERVADVAALEEELDLPFLLESAPSAFEQVIQGLSAIKEIVATIKRMSDEGRTTRTTFDVDLEVKSVLERLAPRIAQAAELEIRLAGTKAIGDPSDLSEALVLLVENAVQAIERTGTRGRLCVSTSIDGDEALIAIADTGAGIPKQIAARVFQPFFTTQEVGRGRGLGLSIARSIIVERNCGKLSFDSIEGEGTTFFVRLPCAPVDEGGV
jgi:signal transduction histidine kinase